MKISNEAKLAWLTTGIALVILTAVLLLILAMLWMGNHGGWLNAPFYIIFFAAITGIAVYFGEKADN